MPHGVEQATYLSTARRDVFIHFLPRIFPFELFVGMKFPGFAPGFHPEENSVAVLDFKILVLVLPIFKKQEIFISIVSY